MFRIPRPALLFPVAALALGVTDVSAGESDAARRCAAIAGNAERLACYDAVFGPPAAERPDATVQATSQVAEAAEPDGAALRDFGLSEADKRRESAKREGTGQPESITATVQSIGRRPTGEQVVTTTDGQVWVEVEAYSRARPQPGETVVIRKAALGSFTLVTSKGIGTKVRRVK